MTLPKQKDHLLYDRCRLLWDRVITNGSTLWRCANSDGSGHIKVSENDDVIEVPDHNYTSDPDQNEAANVD